MTHSKKIIKVEVAYNLFDNVYIKHDPDQLEYMVIGYLLEPKTTLKYKIACGLDTTWCYEQELSSVRNVIKTSKE